MATTTTVCSIFIGAVIEPAYGEWVSLPCDEKVIDEIIENIQNSLDCEEVMISDYESRFSELHIGEYSDPYEVNEMAERLSEYDEEQLEIMTLMMSDWGYDFEDAIDKVDNWEYRIYNNTDSMKDVAMQVLADDPEFAKIPESFIDYFDYDGYGRDLEINRRFSQMANGDYVEIYD